MAWLYLIAAGLFEMSGVLMINKLNKDRNATSFLLLLAGFGGYLFLFLVMKLPIKDPIHQFRWTV